ncbi:MAG: Ger(x)C family spore germination C-terminal domain-containing protein, partial [Ignavibacteriales bacterium]
INVSSPIDGDPVTLEILRGSANIAPEIRGGRIIMHINIKQEGNFYEERSTYNLLTQVNLKKLENQENNKIKADVAAAVKKAQKIDSDIFGFGSAISRKYPAEWKQLQKRWEKVFPHVEIKVKVESKIRRAGLRARIFKYK